LIYTKKNSNIIFFNKFHFDSATNVGPAFQTKEDIRCHRTQYNSCSGNETNKIIERKRAKTDGVEAPKNQRIGVEEKVHSRTDEVIRETN
jgi:hypothetical protein